MTLEQGQVVRDRYRVARVLGEDEFGAVYRAWDLNVNGSCILEEVFDPSGGMGRWFEGRSAQLKKLSHENLPKVLETFSLPMHGHYLVVELVDGKTAEEELESQGQLPGEERILAWMIQVSEALSYLHVQEPPILHCAVKPGNILISGGEKAHLVGYRVASVISPEEVVTPGVAAASAGFSPPEIYGRGRLQPSSDVYSLAATIYKLFTKQQPPESLLVLGKDLPPPESVYEINPQIDYQISTSIQKALNLDLENRFESVEAFKRVLIGEPELFAPILPLIPALEPQSEAQFVDIPAPVMAESYETITYPPSEPFPETGIQQVEVSEHEAVTVGLKSIPPAYPPAAPPPPSTPPPPRKRRWGLLIGGVILLLLVLGGLCLGGYFLYPTVMEMVQSSTPTTTATFTPTFTPLFTDTPIFTNTPEASPTSTPLPTQMVDELGVRMALIGAGSFKMGNDQGEMPERPSHTVNLDAYYIDMFEVTNARYEACVQAGACQTPTISSSNKQTDYYGNPDFADYPVIYVTWEMAKAYCEWRGGSLPSEAQWERAARGEDERTFPWGEGADCSLANFWEDGGNCLGDTAKVGSYPGGVSPYGLYDMAGNAWEWVLDWFGETFYGVSPADNPLGPMGGQMKVMRGGSWSGGALQCRTTTRGRAVPTKGYYNTGFRCVWIPQ